MAVTVNVAVCGGVTVRTAVLVTPPALAVKVTGVGVTTELVPMANPALVFPWATVTRSVPGPAATVPSLEVTDTRNPPVGAGLLIVTVPMDWSRPWTVVGFSTNAVSVSGGVMVSTALADPPPYEPLMVEDVEVATETVLTAKVMLSTPAGIVMLAGTVAADGLLLASETTAPPEGAVVVRVTVACAELPPTKEDGLSDTLCSDGGGVTVSVALRVDPIVGRGDGHRAYSRPRPKWRC